MKPLILSSVFMALAIPAVFAQSMPLDAKGTGRDSGIVSQPKHQQAATDASFVKKSIRTGLYQMAAAELATTTSQNPRIHKLATMILNDRREGNRSLAMIAASAGFDIPEKPSKQMRTSVEWLSKYSGPEFDNLYAQQVIAVCGQNILLYEMVAERTNNSFLKRFINETLPKLRSHLAEARQIGANIEAELPTEHTAMQTES